LAEIKEKWTKHINSFDYNTKKRLLGSNFEQSFFLCLHLNIS
jgi:hypothetical protein